MIKVHYFRRFSLIIFLLALQFFSGCSSHTESTSKKFGTTPYVRDFRPVIMNVKSQLSNGNSSTLNNSVGDDLYIEFISVDEDFDEFVEILMQEISSFLSAKHFVAVKEFEDAPHYSLVSYILHEDEAETLEVSLHVFSKESGRYLTVFDVH